MSNSQTEMSSQDLDPEITLGVLKAVEGNDSVTQRSLAKELGIALGLANAYLKRCAKKGLIKNYASAGQSLSLLPHTPGVWREEPADGPIPHDVFSIFFGPPANNVKKFLRPAQGAIGIALYCMGKVILRKLRR